MISRPRNLIIPTLVQSNVVQQNYFISFFPSLFSGCHIIVLTSVKTQNHRIILSGYTISAPYIFYCWLSWRSSSLPRTNVCVISKLYIAYIQRKCPATYFIRTRYTLIINYNIIFSGVIWLVADGEFELV